MFADKFFFLEGEAAADPFPRAGVAPGRVELGAAQDGEDVGLGGGEIDGLDKLVCLQARGVRSPAAGAGDARVVFG